MSRRLRAALIAVAAAAVGCFVWSGSPWRAPYLPFFVSTALIGLAFLAAGIAAWQRWPASRLGLLFSIVGYAYLVPYTIVNLPNSVAFTVANLTESVSGAALAHLALAWPSGRLRSRFERRVVIAEYAWNLGTNLVSTLFWNPSFSGCNASCPANLLLVRSSRSVWDAVNVASIPGSLALTGIVLALIIRHWRSARGWSRRVMTPLLWISVAVIAESSAKDIVSNLNLGISNSVFFNGIAPLVVLAGPALVIADTVRVRSARGAVGTAVVDLEPGASPALLRDALARALGDSTLQLAFRLPDGSGYLDTSGQAVEVARPGPGRTVTPVADAGVAVLIHDAGLEHEPQLVRMTAAAAGLALEHSRLQAEVQAQLEQVRASRARIVEADDAERRRLERDLHDGAQQRLVTLSLALGMARDRAAGADPELEALIESAGKEGAGGADRAARACPRHPSRGADRDRADRGDPGAGRALAGGHHDHRGAGRAVPGRDRGHRVLRGLRGAGQRG
jgi:signal transduction histidine kinase